MGIHSEGRHSVAERNDVKLQERACLTIERDELHVHGLCLVVNVVAVHEVCHAVHGVGIVKIDIKNDGVGSQIILRARTQRMHKKARGYGMKRHPTICQSSAIFLCGGHCSLGCVQAAHSKDAHRVRGNEMEWNGFRALFVASHWHRPGCGSKTLDLTQTLGDGISNVKLSCTHEKVYT